MVKYPASKKTTENPCENASFISKLFFWWTFKLFKKGTQGTLTSEDMYDPLNSDESERLVESLERTWNEELRKLQKLEYSVSDTGTKVPLFLKPSLTRAIVKCFWLSYVHIGILLLFQVVALRTMQPILQGWIINFFNPKGENPTTQNQALCYAAGLLLDTLIMSFILHHTNLDGQRIGMKVRVACSSLIYRKSLRLSKAAQNSTAAGQVVNLLSNDVNRFDILPTMLHYVWIMPIEVAVVGYIIWQSIYACMFAGIGLLLVLGLPIQFYMSAVGAKLRKLIAELTDRRVQLMSELIGGIQVVKMYAWEKPFNAIVSQTRRSEMKKIRQSSYLRGFHLSIAVFAERVSLFLSLITFVLTGNTMTAELAFQLASYFNTLQLVTVIFFPMALMLYGECQVSILRIEEFLQLDEIVYNSSKQILPTPERKNPVTVEFNRLSANWTMGQLPPTLCDISLKVPGGQLCSLVGPVGSGKSSLLNILLQEMPIGAGTVSLRQFDAIVDSNARGFIVDNPHIKISYSSQDPWLFSASVRENILFGQEYEEQRYHEVTRVCSLLRDFKQMPQGDATIVGERGMSLSGGQRARINLARAIYREADLYLLDDPLSALDARIARRVFEDCIVKFLSGKTRILVTHQIHFLKEADQIAVIDRGSLKHQGTFEMLSVASVEFKEMLNRLEEEKEEKVDGEDKKIVRGFAIELGRCSVKSQDSYRSMIEEASVNATNVRTIIEEETMVSGPMSRKIYTDYFKSGGGKCSLTSIVLLFLLSVLSCSGADYFLSYWTNLEDVRSCLHDPQTTCDLANSQYNTLVNDTFFQSLSLLGDDGLLPTNYAIYVYTICMLAVTVLVVVRNIVFMDICTRASRNLHTNMFSNILQTTMLFFNTNPSGRILNRFSKDIGVMDELLPRAMLGTLQIFGVFIGIILLTIVVNFWMIIPIVILGICLYFVKEVYLNTSQDIKRIEGIAKSPIFSHVSSTLNGLTTIRSCGGDVKTMMQAQFDDYQDKHSGTWFLTIATEAAVGLAVDFICCLLVGCVCFSFIFIGPGNTYGGFVGLAISQSLILTGMIQYGMKQSTEMNAYMTGVERVLQYTNLPKEQNLDVTTLSEPSTWPASGKIQFRRVFLSYKQGDSPVLKNIDLTIEPGWKVGVVGRTGAGKSSLISALFRLVTDGLDGDILIDNVNTRTVRLQNLRASMSIIPQEPVLFSESLRYNLDPFSQYPDDVLWDALREVELMDLRLDQWVVEGGANFSVGQRQLICLARAIVRNNRILVLDEATANIDSRTDALIQRTIRSKFVDCTVITIAHRLNTIIDCDRVLVMDAGRVAEFDEPYELLFNMHDSEFFKMVRQTGEVMAQKLLEEAAARRNTDLNNSNIQRVLDNFDDVLDNSISI